MMIMLALSSAFIRRSVLAAVAASGFGLVLPAATCYAQTGPAASAGASVMGPSSTTVGATAEHGGNAIRPFRIDVPEAALVDKGGHFAA